ncbi:MAG: nucleotide exchange factor GrpE [Candidatus Altiarchaeia archaeon]
MSSPEKARKNQGKEISEEVVSTVQDEEISELKDRIGELEDRIHEQDCTNLRLRADFENYRKQLEKDKEDFMKWANKDLLLEVLEVADNFERAIPQLRKKDPEGAEGMEMIYRQLMKTLEKYGLSKMEAVGKKFDACFHEAFLQEENDGPEGVILEELQGGYTLKGKVLRPAKVKVSKCRS